MKGSEKRLMQFMDGSNKRFIIPVYQRNYSWKLEHCKQLLDDLKSLISKNNTPHFFGSVVSSHMEGGNREDFLIIDGQQRITTISILLLAIVHLIKEGKVIPKKDSLSMQILETHLIDKYQNEERKIRLKPIKDDCDAFDALFSEGNFKENSTITKNFTYFANRIINENICVDDLYDAICRLEIVDIFLEKEDNPQLIFESLNSTGLELEEGDKIRNYILMGLPSKKQDEYYYKYWANIEKQTNFNVSEFFRTYLTLKLSRTVIIRDVYFTFKSQFSTKDINEELFKELLEYSYLYNKIINPLEGGKTIFRDVLYRLNYLDFSVTYPTILAILYKWKKGALSEQEVKKLLITIECYIFRRTIVGLPTNSLSKIFANLDKDASKLVRNNNVKYLDAFNYILLSKENNSRFPDDIEFKNELLNRNIYNMNSKYKNYLFSYLENRDSKEQIDVISKIENRTYTIEHIMPQTLSDEWINELGKDYKEIYNQYLHTLPNLTLTGYNSKYSNRSFSEKKSIENGFKDSNLRLNQFIASRRKWGKAQLDERKDELSKIAFKLWTYPKTSYIPTDLENSISNDDEE